MTTPTIRVRRRVQAAVFGAVVAALLGPVPVAAQPGDYLPAVPQLIRTNSGVRVLFAVRDTVPEDGTFGIEVTRNGTVLGEFGLAEARFQGRDDATGLLIYAADVENVPPGQYRVRVLVLHALGVDYSPLSNPLEIPPPGSPDPPPPGPDPNPPPGPGSPGPPATPVLLRPVVNGNTVTLTWTYSGPAITGFEIIAEVQATGDILRLQVPPDARTFVRGGVPSGNFIVSMRALRNGSGSPLSDTFIVPVGVTLGAGDLSVTLTWNSTADIDLHVVEPNGTHVYYASRQGTTARLDRDDTDGFGPENIFVEPGRALVGNYRIYIVHFGRAVPTVSRIQVTVNAGTPNERTMVFSRQTTTPNTSQSIEVAVADPLAGTIQPRALLGDALLEWETAEEIKIPES